MLISILLLENAERTGMIPLAHLHKKTLYLGSHFEIPQLIPSPEAINVRERNSKQPIRVSTPCSNSVTQLLINEVEGFFPISTNVLRAERIRNASLDDERAVPGLS